MVVICVKCYGEFATNRDLERHLDRKIPCDEGDFRCCGCCQPFKTKKNLNEHINKNRCKGKSAALVAHLLGIENARLENELQQREVASSSGGETLAIHSHHADAGNRTDQLASHEEPSQPPADASLAIIDQAGFFEFENKKIRKTSETPQRVSVYDLIAAITEQDSNNARTSFIRLKEEHSEIAAVCSAYKFPGRGNLTSPATDARGVVLIINALPGHRATQFRLKSADIIVRYLGGDETLIGEIKRNQVIQATVPETNPVRLFGEAVASS